MDCNAYKQFCNADCHEPSAIVHKLQVSKWQYWTVQAVQQAAIVSQQAATQLDQLVAGTSTSEQFSSATTFSAVTASCFSRFRERMLFASKNSRKHHASAVLQCQVPNCLVDLHWAPLSACGLTPLSASPLQFQASGRPSNDRCTTGSIGLDLSDLGGTCAADRCRSGDRHSRPTEPATAEPTATQPAPAPAAPAPASPRVSLPSRQC